MWNPTYQICSTCRLESLEASRAATQPRGKTQGMSTDQIAGLADIRHWNPKAWKALCDSVKDESITQVCFLPDKALVNCTDGVVNRRIILDLDQGKVTDQA